MRTPTRAQFVQRNKRFPRRFLLQEKLPGRPQTQGRRGLQRGTVPRRARRGWCWAARARGFCRLSPHRRRLRCADRAPRACAALARWRYWRWAAASAPPRPARSARTRGCALTRAAMSLCTPVIQRGASFDAGTIRVFSPGQPACTAASCAAASDAVAMKGASCALSDATRINPLGGIALLERQQARHRRLAARIATQSPYALGGTGNGAAPMESGKRFGDVDHGWKRARAPPGGASGDDGIAGCRARLRTALYPATASSPRASCPTPPWPQSAAAWRVRGRRNTGARRSSRAPSSPLSWLQPS